MVLAAVDEQRGDMVAALDRLLAIPSLGGTAAEVDAQAHLAEKWSAEGLDVDTWSLDLAALRAHPDFPGMEVTRTGGLGVTATLHGRGNGPTLLLDGHTDVVPAGDLGAWSGDPFIPRHLTRAGQDIVIARGSADMKAGVISAWFAVRAIRSALGEAALAGDVILAPVSGEEDGGLGTFALLAHGVRADACIIPEPTDLDIMLANGGALTFRLTIRGQATHASRRTEGVSALDLLVPVMAALADLEARRCAHPDPLMGRWSPAYPLSIGTVHAGDWASSVPDLLVAEGRYGVALGESVDAARAEFEACIAAVSAADPWLREHPVEVTWWGGQFASGRTDPEALIVDVVRRAQARAQGRIPEAYAGPYGSDLRLLVGHGGIPTLQYGPGDARFAHGPDEWVAVDDVVACARGIALAVLDFCS